MTIQAKEIPLFDNHCFYKEETFINRRAGTLRRLTPVLADGSPDGSRRPLFIGQTQMKTKTGVVPLNFKIYADTLEEATEKLNEKIIAAHQATTEEKSRLTNVENDFPANALPA